MRITISVNGTNQFHDSAGRMHLAQQAFQEYHALQCGYCTPGMVMAITSLPAESSEPTKEDIRVGLEGNLCRCTGYHNIVAAALAASRVPELRA